MKAAKTATNDEDQAMGSDASIPDIEEKGLLPYENVKSRESQRETLRVCYPEQYAKLVQSIWFASFYSF